MRVLVFGDSITYGIWDTAGGWVQRLRTHYDKLQLADNPFEYEQPSIFNMGVGGDDTNDVLMRFDADTKGRIWHDEEFAFIFAVGINDSYTSDDKKEFTPAQYGRNLQLLISKARKFSNKILFVGITPVDETQRVQEKDTLYINKRILEFEEVLCQICEQDSLPYVSVYQTLKDEMVDGVRLFDDGLHPNDTGHELIFQLVRPELDKLLNT